jgi:hypothetical protein
VGYGNEMTICTEDGLEGGWPRVSGRGWKAILVKHARDPTITLEAVRLHISAPLITFPFLLFALSQHPRDTKTSPRACHHRSYHKNCRHAPSDFYQKPISHRDTHSHDVNLDESQRRTRNRSCIVLRKEAIDDPSMRDNG